MNLIRVASYEEMSIKAGSLIVEKVRSNPEMILGLATGSTPLGLYKYLIKDHNDNGTTYKNIKTANLDEYIGIPANNHNSYHAFMMKNFFNHIDIDKDHTLIPNGGADDLEEECTRYEKKISALGGIDLQILGIGENGHIGFNEPGTSFQSRTHIVTLAENTRQANARFFNSMHEVPKQAITMGISTIMDSREIFLLASGDRKAEAIKRLVTGDVSEEFPASVLKQHQNVTILADDAALKYI